jgi:DNA-binding PadR family transcriptional regulator
MKWKRVDALLLAVVDYGLDGCKEMRKNMEEMSNSAFYALIYNARMKGFIRSVGVGKYELTDEGEERLKEQMKYMPQPNGSQVTVRRLEQTPDPEADSEVKEEKVEGVVEEVDKVSDIDWAREYIILSNKLVDCIFDHKKEDRS